ncbi:hypothetical protein SAMN05421823_11564 [Catalinimonas alkaloidigena]|uniref:Uncharacterized protein n=1 Tax=Catalinimonas alkaloidigena TaxID=1075417 RepID=A0A1G9U231_9BACT|nr:hypothetical protein [Catalinimonas alkaloidigena]SDM54070.1 hypothetical protein SAMN05421823_11564 [Catalinimonas alkaloidigena]
MSGTKDITALASLIKGKKQEVTATPLPQEASRPAEAATETTETGAARKASPRKRKTSDPSSLTQFMTLVEEINQVGEEFDNTGILYVDGDIHEVLKLLKTNCKLKISSLGNYLLKAWIEENQAAINAALVKKRNKFLD